MLVFSCCCFWKKLMRWEEHAGKSSVSRILKCENWNMFFVRDCLDFSMAFYYSKFSKKSIEMVFGSAFVRQNGFWSCFQKYSLSKLWRNWEIFRFWQFSGLENCHFLTVFSRIKYVFICSEVSRLIFNISFWIIFQKNFRPNCIRFRKMAHSANVNRHSAGSANFGDAICGVLLYFICKNAFFFWIWSQISEEMLY